MSAKNKAILEKANAAVASGDIEGFLTFCSEDTNWVFVGDRTLEGKDAVRRWMKESYLQPPVNKVERLIAEGDFVTALGDIAVKDKEGRVTRSTYCDVWRVSDGKLAELRAFVVEGEGR
jgi:ketosteroid isomerase-like protein